MTTKKKLTTIGVALSLLAAVLVWNPGGKIGLLTSRMINQDNPLVDHQIFSRDTFGSASANRTNDINNLNNPNGVAVHENKIFIVNTNHHQVRIYNLIPTINSTGERTKLEIETNPFKIIGRGDRVAGNKLDYSGSDTELSFPKGIVIDPSNNAFYITDSNNHRVLKFDLTTYKLLDKIGGNQKSAAENHFVYPTGITIDKNNDYLYVVDGAYQINSCRIKRFSLNNLLQTGQTTGGCGNTIDKLGSYYYGPESIVTDWAGNVYVADTYNNRVVKYDNQLRNPIEILKSTLPAETINEPRGLFIDKGGYLYVTNGNKNRLQKYDIKVAGNPFVRGYGTGADDVKMNKPMGIFVDNYTDIYVSEANNNRIHIFRQHIIVPTAPTDVIVNPNVTQVEIRWDAASPRNGTPLLDYVVEYKKTSDANWSRFWDGVGTNTNAIITNLSANTEYQFRVFARNTAREDGDRSAIITKKTLNTTAPKAPTGLTAEVANRQINLRWTASDTNGGSAISDYIVEYRLASGGQWIVLNEGVRTTTNAQVTGLTNDTRYDFRVKAKNSTGNGAFSPYSAIVSRSPTPDDRCNNISGVQNTIPQNLKRDGDGNCVCINEGVLASASDPAVCNLTCDARHEPVKPQFKVVYDEGFPRLYQDSSDTVGAPITARRIIISDRADGTIRDTNTLIPLFKPNVQPFYDGAIIQDASRLSLSRNGNRLKVLWYGNRTDGKIERVKGKIIIEGSPDIKWTGIEERDSIEEDSDKVRIPESNKKVVEFDMMVSPANDAFVVRFDLGSRADACVEKPLVIFDKNAQNATGAMADQVLQIVTPTALRANTFSRPGYTFDGWNTAADGTGTRYANSANYAMSIAQNITLYAQWKPNTYTVTFDSQGATTAATPATKTVVVPATNVGTLPSIPVRTGYRFDGWYTAPNGAGTQFTATTPVNANSTVYAKWTISTYTVTATAGSNGTIGTPATRSVTHGSTTTFTITPNPGYKATVTGGCGGSLSGNTYTTGAITDNCSLNVVFSRTSAPSCTGNRPANSTVMMGIGTSTTSRAWIHSGSPTGSYQFCTFQCPTGTSYNSTNNTCEITTHTVTFQSNGGSSVANKTAQYNTTITAPATPIRSNYMFNGWYKEVSLTTPWNFGTDKVTSNTTLYAKWTYIPPTTEPPVTTQPTFGQCGSAATTYSASSTSYGNNPEFCRAGTPNPSIPSFPAIGATARWTCQGENGGTSASCTATTAKISLTAIGSSTGTAQVGQTLTAGALNPSGATVTYTWQRADAASGSYENITTTPASSSTYTLTTNDLGKFVRVSVSGTGNYTGTRVSDPSAQIASAPDTTAPTVTAFSLPETSSTYLVNITTFTASEDNVSYLLTESATKPASNHSGWTQTKPTSYNFNSVGQKTLYAWVKDAAGNVSNNSSDSVTVTLPQIIVPTVVHVTSSVPNGSYRATNIIPIAVEFSQPVTVTGIPTLLLETGANDAVATYKETLTDGKTVVFEYVVTDGHTSNDLSYVGTGSLRLPNDTASIKDTSTQRNADLTLPDISSTHSLSSNKAIIIDTTRPARPLGVIVPQQTNVTLSSSSNGSLIYNVTTNSLLVNVACTSGEKVHIKRTGSFSPVTTVNCTQNPVSISLNLSSGLDVYTFFAAVEDAAGNESDGSPAITVLKTQPTVNPAPGIPDLVPESDLGVSSTDNITSVNQPIFAMTCTPGAVVNLYNAPSTTPLGVGVCVANTVQILPTQPLAAGEYRITAKQFVNNIASESSSELRITIENQPLTVTLARSSTQAETTSSPTIQFTATFNRSIDASSFVCNDMSIVNGTCGTITSTSTTTYTFTVTAVSSGQVRVNLPAGKVQTLSGSVNAQSNESTVTYVTTTTPSPAVVQCGDLRTLTVTNPTSSSLDTKNNLCQNGEAGRVTYSSSDRKWSYRCRGVDGTTVSCTVSAVLNSASSSVCGENEEKELPELDFDSCTLKTTNAFTYYQYLTCLGITEKKRSCDQLGCGQEAKRQELIDIAVRIRGIPLDDGYECQGLYSDVKSSSSGCETIEKARIAGLISAKNKQFRPRDTMTRAETFKVFLGSICEYPQDSTSNWQNDVAKASKKLGFTTRSVSTFEPNKPILRQELYVLSARVAQWKSENPDTCDDLPEELICEE